METPAAHEHHLKEHAVTVDKGVEAVKAEEEVKMIQNSVKEETEAISTTSDHTINRSRLTFSGHTKFIAAHTEFRKSHGQRAIGIANDDTAVARRDIHPLFLNKMTAQVYALESHVFYPSFDIPYNEDSATRRRRPRGRENPG
ncbi:uncharacterized protein PITG_19804 [Phytophthora infestans T30-4]|uniref:Uncharacterized protein n=1 Tax=Phytophthora infestans (strain T30-4) TaxID=403677 RepID=D0P1F8_PHYIT|nr:uncharacterized protein PITG_19804 [Phytophthora infestans T30-4]EEY54580.1 hypothetical protein PITG_19804 [Phytophthora infestans T30-4]|eukprot:XP_002895860.1 hypothetical protein PITG_19804 [Phytophthora infestans T30-4]